MALFKRKHKEYAGLLIDKGLFRFISLKGDSGGIEVVQTAFGAIPNEFGGEDPFGDSGARLESVFSYVRSETGALSMPVNFALPVNDSLLRIVPLPDMEPDEAKQAFRFDYERYFPFSAEESVYDLAQIIYPLPGNTEEKRYLAAAARRGLVDNLMEAAAAQDFNVAAIEPSQIALERAVTPVIAPSDACIFIYAGFANSVFTLSWKGNGVFYRAIPIGFGAKPEPFDPEMAPDDAPQFAFVRQARSSQQFALSQIRGFTPDSVYLYGPGASEGVCSLLKDALDIQNVMVSDPLLIHGVELNPADAEAGLWDIPIGLALRFI